MYGERKPDRFCRGRSVAPKTAEIRSVRPYLSGYDIYLPLLFFLLYVYVNPRDTREAGTCITRTLHTHTHTRPNVLLSFCTRNAFVVCLTTTRRRRQRSRKTRARKSYNTRPCVCIFYIIYRRRAKRADPHTPGASAAAAVSLLVGLVRSEEKKKRRKKGRHYRFCSFSRRAHAPRVHTHTQETSSLVSLGRERVGRVSL